MERKRMKKWKGFLAKVLVLALVISSITIPQQKAVTVEASTDPTMPTEDTSKVAVGDAKEYMNALVNYVQGTETGYENGIVIELTADLDFASYQSTGLTIASGNIWIDMAGFNIWNAPQDLFYLSSLEVPEADTYSTYMKVYNSVVDGNSAITWSGDVTETTIEAGAKLVFSDVDVNTACFAVRAGAALNVDGIDYVNTLDSLYTLYHQPNEATYRFYEGVGETSTAMVYIENVYEGSLTEGSYAVDKFVAANTTGDYWIGRYVYAADALPASVSTITYNDNSYTRPTTEFIVDYDYGVYHLSEDGTTMTIYAADEVIGYTTELLSEGLDTTVICATITKNFTPYIVNEADGKVEDVILTTTVQAKNVIFTDASILEKDSYGDVEYDIGKIRIYGTDEGNYVSKEIQFDFQFAEGRSLPIYNLSDAAVTTTEGNEIWVKYPSVASLSSYISVVNDESASADKYVTISVAEEDQNHFDNRNYLAAGATVTLTPVENYTIYDIQVGGFTTSDMGEYDYSYGRRLPASEIKHYVDGTKEFTVPSFGSSFSAKVREMETIKATNPSDTSYDGYTFDTIPVYEEMKTNPENSSEVIDIDWMNEGFSISAVENEEPNTQTSEIAKYELVENEAIADGTLWNGTSAITETEEGLELTKTYKLINKSVKEVADSADEDFDGDTSEMITIPGTYYGMESWVTYTYTLDTTNPVITGVTATGVTTIDGTETEEAIKLNGGWQIEGDTVTAETVWTAAEKVVLDVTASDGDAGTGVVGYQFKEEYTLEDIWNTDSFAEYTEEGVYNLEIYVRDQMQEYASDGVEVVVPYPDKWITSFGIDRTAPEVSYSDAISIALGGDNILTSDNTYKGSLVFEVFDEGSGFGAVTVYEKNDAGEWIENSDAFVVVSAEVGAGSAAFYISGEEEDKTYRIDISDAAGNMTSYTNVVVSDSSIEVGTADEFLQHLMAYQQMSYASAIQEGVPNVYPTGLSLALTNNIDFTDYTVGLPDYFPAGMVWIETNGYNLTNMPAGLFDMTAEHLPEEIREGATFFLDISGGGQVGWQENDMGVTDMLVGENATLQIIGTDECFADVTGIRFVIEENAVFRLKSLEYANPADSGYTRYYYGDEGIYRIYHNEDGEPYHIYFEDLLMSNVVDENDYIDARYIPRTVLNDGITSFEKYTYEPGVLSEARSLLFDGGAYGIPATDLPFSVDEEYGIYAISEDGTEITVFALPTANTDLGNVYGIEAVAEGSTEETAYLIIGSKYLDDLNSRFETVNFEQGAILMNYDKEDGTSLFVSNVYIETEGEADSDKNMRLIFGKYDTTVRTFYNRSGFRVTFVDAYTGETVDNELWVMWQGGAESDSALSIANAKAEGLVTKVQSGYCYVEEGSSFSIVPEEGYTVYNIDFGNWIPENENDYYLIGNTEYIRILPSGERVITIPSHSVTITADSSVIEVSGIRNGEDAQGYIFEGETFPSIDESVDYYREIFFIHAAYDETFDEETGLKRYYSMIPLNADGTRSDVMEYYRKCQEEGIGLSESFILVDASLEKVSVDTDGDGVADTTEVRPVSTYGKEVKLSYDYVLDIDSPTISNVTVTDSSNNELPVTGVWQDRGEGIAETDTIWTNKAPVTVTVTAEDGTTGTGVAGYLFEAMPDEQGTWQDANTAAYTEEGFYQLSIQVKDQFDKLTGNTPSNHYVTGFGIDTTAPKIYWKDATSTELELLTSDATFEGNPYFEVVDEASGFGSIGLYELVGEEWVFCEEGLGKVYDDTNTLTGYYLTATDADKNYRIEVMDIAGNLAVFDYLTVSGYEQNIDIAMSEPVTTYGQSASVTIIVTNTSEVDLEIQAFTLREEASYEGFALATAETSTLKAGEMMTATLTLPSTVNAGEYTAMFDIAYTTTGTDVTTTVAKAYSDVVTVTVAKAEGTGTLTIAENYYYGEIPSPIAESITNGNNNVTIAYKNASSEENEYTETVPTEVGSYIARAIFAEVENYKEVFVEKAFKITRMAASADMYELTTPDGSNNWYTSEVTITGLNGNLLAVSETDAFTESLTIKESADTFSFYIRTSSGAITEKVELTNVKIDATSPEIGEEEGIFAVNTWWQTFLEVITFGLYQSETETIQIRAHDDESGMASISYYVSDAPMSMEEIVTWSEWTEGTELTIEAKEESEYVVYARLENQAGLVTYISTDGIVIEVKATPITGAGKIRLEIGVPYQLGEGQWSVAGDTTVYAGGIVFYVVESDEFEFSITN